MALTIFYSGVLRNPDLLSELEAEVIDICTPLGWSCKPLHPYPDVPLKGFSFHPEGCEPVWMTFQPDGRLIDPVFFVFREENMPPSPENGYWLTAATQYAGMDAHMALIKLLKYLKQKYFEEFDLVDESEYWETDDAQICFDHFQQFTIWMDDLSRQLDPLDGRFGETGETFLKRMAALLFPNENIM